MHSLTLLLAPLVVAFRAPIHAGSLRGPVRRGVAMRADAGGDDAAAAAPAAPAEDEGFEVTMSGLKIRDDVVGGGETPETGNIVKVEYTGWLSASGFKFDSSKDRGVPFTFEIGQGKVIPGWDEGVASMKVGGKRTMLIPARLAYGEQNVAGGLIPPNSELKFECELIEVKKGGAALAMNAVESAKGVASNFGVNPFTFFAVLLVLVSIAPNVLPDDSFLNQGGNPFASS